MPQTIVLDDNPPIGFAAAPARDGAQVLVQTSGTAYSEDGTKLVTWLEGLVSPLLAKLRPSPDPSSIHHFVAVLRQDRTATVYVNEVRLLGQVRTKGAVRKGAPVYIDQVADFGRLRMDRITVPPDAGLIVVLSSGWRRGVFFDLGPLAGTPREFDVEAVLGAFWGYVAFEARIRVTDDQWKALLDHDWFPFVGIKLQHLQALLGHVDSGWDPDEVLPDIVTDLKTRCEGLLAHAEKVPAMANHLEVFSTAVRHYIAGDALSAAGLLYPRIEGILRGHAGQLPGTPNYSQGGLANAAAVDRMGTRLPGSLLLPDRFKEFLEKVYFAPFDPANVEDVSRNSVSHGVAPEDKLDLKAATIALLTVEQLLYLCGTEKETTDAPRSGPTSNAAKNAARRARKQRGQRRKKR